jgi:hypothetical protein
MSYSIDQFGVIRDAENRIVPQVESDALYQIYLPWLLAGGVCTEIIADAPKPELAKYKTEALSGLLEMGNRFVKGLTADLLECELQTFPTLIAQAKAYMAGVRGDDVCQITIQALMTQKAPEAVAQRTLLLATQMAYVTPIMSGMRQNANMMISACTTHEQVDGVVVQIKANAKAVIDQMMSQVGTQGGL